MIDERLLIGDFSVLFSPNFHHLRRVGRSCPPPELHNLTGSELADHHGCDLLQATCKEGLKELKQIHNIDSTREIFLWWLRNFLGFISFIYLFCHEKVRSNCYLNSIKLVFN